MKITVDGDQTFHIALQRITNVEGMAVERATGMLFKEWFAGLKQGSMLALTGLVWIAMKRTQPDLRFSDVEFSTLDVDQGDEQAAAEADPKDEGSKPDE